MFAVCLLEWIKQKCSASKYRHTCSETARISAWTAGWEERAVGRFTDGSWKCRWLFGFSAPLGLCNPCQQDRSSIGSLLELVPCTRAVPAGPALWQLQFSFVLWMHALHFCANKDSLTQKDCLSLFKMWLSPWHRRKCFIFMKVPEIKQTWEVGLFVCFWGFLPLKAIALLLVILQM